MESGMLTPKKRKAGEFSGDEVYKFKVLLPNAYTLDLILRDRGPKMAVDEFIDEVRKQYIRDVQSSDAAKGSARIKWKGGSLVLQDLDGVKIGTALMLKNYEADKCHTLRIHDEGGERIDTFENMWDLTPDTDLLKELPEEYTFETALADLIDNSLQAVWSNDKSNARFIDIDVLEDRVSIFDSGPGMDGSDENSIVKWGKMGASLHRGSKQQAIGGKPPYLKPYFGMFGYGGPIASMHLGSRALVSSKTKESKKVYFLHLEKDALIRGAGSKLSWKTRGGIRDPLKDEVERAPCGSFTKVEIFEPKRNNLDISKLRCWLKDIYFPYIQCDELSKTGKTVMPVKFQVNGIDLAEVVGGEVATTNLHSSNGPEFVVQVHFSSANNSGSRSCQEANARLRCVYFPICKGKESIENILEKLQVDKHKTSERFETFSRVSIRRLGRLLPDARWPLLPFMDLRHKKGNIKSQLLKRCCLRVICFIDIDAGINPTPSKTNLAPQNHFTIALMKLGDSLLDNDRGVDVSVYKDDKLLSPVQLEKEYNDWILDMHNRFDEESDRGKDEAVIVLIPDKGKKKELGILSDVGRFHKVIPSKKTDKTWKSGQNVKILKGACTGVHKQHLYATLEFFVYGGFEGDTGGEPKLICRPIDTPEEHGCRLSECNGDTTFDLGKSTVIPLCVLDSEKKCVPLQPFEWKNLVEKRQHNSPSTIELLSPKQYEELKLDGEELHESVQAGKAPPKLVVAVVRPSNFVPGSDSKNLDQKHICKCTSEILLEVKFKDKMKAVATHVYSGRVPPSQINGIQGIYKFQLGWKSSDLFKKLGVYTFSFSLIDSRCITLVKSVEINASSKIGRWKIAGSSNQRRPFCMRVGTLSKSLSVECYDIYDNQTNFTLKPRVRVTLEAPNGAVLHVKDFKASLVISKSTLKVEELLVESCDLDKIRPTYEAKLIISSLDEQFSDSIPCSVNPGCVKLVEARPSILSNQLFPGFVVKELELKMFDEFGNSAPKGSEVEIKLEGFQFLNQLGLKRKVDDRGCVDLSGMLKVTATYGDNVSLTVLSNGRGVFNEAFHIEKRELRMASKVPEFLTAGSQLEDLVFEIVNPEGNIDGTIHHEEKFSQSHMLTIKADWLEAAESIRYTFKYGSCTVPTISLPQAEGCFRFEACHSRHSCLSLSVEVHLVKPVQNPELDYGENQTPYSSGNQLLLEEVGKKFLISTQNDIKERWDGMCAIGLEIGNLEKQLELLNEHKEEVEQTMRDLQGSASPCLLALPGRFSKREEVVEEIQKTGHSAAAFLCNISRVDSFQKLQKEVVRDFIGVVALLGRVHSIQLSRVLSEYLGTDQMLAVVTRSFEAASSLERYRQNGEVDYSHALHGEASKFGKSLNGRFLVICLEDISPYEGISESDPQQMLCLYNRAALPGFLGFAVNMIDLDEDQLSVQTDSGHGLRETLFYRLFGKLQVYRTRTEMLDARGSIKHGAVSLDGGILKENGMISLGHGNSDICFQVVTTMENETPGSQEVMKQLDEHRSELIKTNEALAEANENHAEKKKRFEAMKDEYDKIIDMVGPILGTQGNDSM